MRVSELRQDGRGQSEIAGAILMVALVVAVVGLSASALLSVDTFGNDRPPAEFAFEFDASSTSATCGGGDLTANRSPRWGELTVIHDGGDGINGTRLAIVSGASGGSVELAGDCGVNRATPGTSVSVLVDSDDTIRVVWTGGESGSTTVLETWTAPDA